MLKYTIVALLTLLATPAAAAEFYVAQNPTTKDCDVVEVKPDGQTLIMVGTGPYKTRKEARDAKKAAAECVSKKEGAN
jgi:hypothetical protein